ncbi:MAG: hypothetical protein ACLFU5_09430, partial [Thermoplasmata archaeon]
YNKFERLVERATKSLEECSCESVKGCPACTFSADCGNDNDPLNRILAIDLLNKVKKSRKN